MVDVLVFKLLAAEFHEIVENRRNGMSKRKAIQKHFDLAEVSRHGFEWTKASRSMPRSGRWFYPLFARALVESMLIESAGDHTL